jgi:hypothetical protein
MVYRAVNEEKSAWRESAPYWEKNSEIIHQMSDTLRKNNLQC